MMAPSRRSLGQRVWENILLRVILYYIILGVALTLLWKWMPANWHAFFAKSVTELTGGGGQGRAGVAKSASELLTEQVEGVGAEGQLAVSAALAITFAFLASLPVAWIYILTRAKKGYRQAMAHALIVLPVVDAGIVVLVKNSLPLAFSLAGIVAAVRFRNTLEDSKDAVYILVAAAIGLSSGVQVPVAIVMSIGFNIVMVLLWKTDFGRNPAGLEGALAEERLERTREQIGHTTSFVAVVDDELLKEMSPAQLDALADRAWRRRKKMNPELDKKAATPEFDHLLRVHCREPGRVRPIVEGVLKAKLQFWRFGDVLHESPTEHVIEFSVYLGEGTPPADLLEAVNSAVGEAATNVQLL
jgi:hypothetical protein